MALIISNFIQDANSGGKFVVLMPRDGSDGGVMALSDFTRDFQHRDIVARWEKTNKTTLSASGLRVAGGGWWKFESPGLLAIYGQSGDYGRFDPAWLRRHLQPGMLLHETRLDIR